MGYVLGADGGGTKTDIFIFHTDGTLVASARGGAANHEVYPGGFSEMTPVFDALCERALRAAGLRAQDVCASVFGLAGLDIPSQKTRMEAHLISRGFHAPFVINDAFLGIKAMCPNGAGVGFVNGTGNSFGGIDLEGNWLQVGGTGLAVGDLSGARGMAEAVLQAVYGAFYCMQPATAMADKFLRLVGAKDESELVERIYQRYFFGDIQPKEIIAILYDSAEEGDAAALALLDTLAERLARSLGGLIGRLSFGDTVDIVLIGSANLKGKAHLLTQRVRERTQALTGKACRMLPLALPPAVGAVLWAIEQVDGAVGPQVRARVLAALSEPDGEPAAR